MAEKISLINVEPSAPKVGKWEKLAVLAIENCPKIKKEREKRILFDRFGIGKKTKTLHAIGQEYTVTRERIRQIVNNAVKKIKKNCKSDEAQKAIDKIDLFVQKSGGYVSSEQLFVKFECNEAREQNAIKFMASLSDKVVAVKESGSMKQGWSLNSVKIAKIKAITKEVADLLKNEKKTMKAKDIATAISEDVILCESVMHGAKALMKTDDGKWGLVSWPHVNPKSIKDKSVYILKRHTKPIHYSELTRRISDISSKNVTQQSVHNELIKNAEFVLVGRGIYALAEWGYAPGVVEEVIVQVLEEAGEPLHKSVIIERVLEKRVVKTSTVVLNLQKPRFKRVNKAVYTLN
jgi:hypothetical protein